MATGDQIGYFRQQLFGFAQDVAGVAGGFFKVQAQAQAEKAQLEIARASMRFRDGLSKMNPEVWIFDDESRGTSAFDDHQKNLQAIAEQYGTNRMAQQAIGSVLNQYLLEDEAYVRTTKNARIKETLVAQVGENIAETLGEAGSPAEQIQLAQALYDEKKQQLVWDSGVYTPEKFDEFYMNAVAPAVTDILMSGIDQAIKLGGAAGMGREAGDAFVDSLQDIGFGGSAVFRMTTDFKAKMKEAVAAKFEDARKANEAGYEETLNTFFARAALGDGEALTGMAAIVLDNSTGGFAYWADPGTREHWASIVAQLSRKDEPTDAEAKKAFEEEFWKRYNAVSLPGKLAPEELRAILLLGNSAGVDPAAIAAESRRLNEPQFETPELDMLIGQVQAMAKPDKDGKYKGLTPAEAGQMIKDLQDYAGSRRMDLKPGELGERFQALQHKAWTKEMEAKVLAIVRRQGAFDTKDAYEEMQLVVQAGRLTGSVMFYTARDGSVTMTASWGEQLQALHAGQKQLYLQDFESEPARMQVLQDADGIMQAGQAVFIAADGKAYAYNVKGNDEELFVRNKDGWEIVRDETRPTAIAKNKARVAVTDAAAQAKKEQAAERRTDVEVQIAEGWKPDYLAAISKLQPPAGWPKDKPRKDWALMSPTQKAAWIKANQGILTAEERSKYLQGGQ